MISLGTNITSATEELQRIDLGNFMSLWLILMSNWRLLCVNCGLCAVSTVSNTRC